jgi:hypothetical protein
VPKAPVLLPVRCLGVLLSIKTSVHLDLPKRRKK